MEKLYGLTAFTLYLKLSYIQEKKLIMWLKERTTQNSSSARNKSSWYKKDMKDIKVSFIWLRILCQDTESIRNKNKQGRQDLSDCG